MKILVMCGGGYSSSALGVRCRKALAEKGNTEDIIETTDMTIYMNMPDEQVDYDVILVAPQIRHKLPNIKAAHPNRLYALCDMRSYGMMDVDGILKQATELLAANK